MNKKTMIIDDEKLYTSEEVMHYLRISRSTFNRWVASGYLKGVKIGWEWRFKAKYVKELVR